MKVLFLNPIGTLGGAEHVLLDLIASLRRASPQLQLELVALQDGPLLRAAASLRIGTDLVPLPQSLATLGESGTSLDPARKWVSNARAAADLVTWLPKFAANLRSKRAEIIHSNGLKTHLLGALARPRGVPLVWHLHDFISERRVTARVLPLLQRRAAIAIAVSQAVARDAREVLKSLRIETLLNGIRTEAFTPGTVAPVDLDALAGLEPAPDGTLRVGLVATYASWKGHHLFLEAARQVAASGVRFYVIGGPVYSTTGSQVTEAELTQTISRLQLGDRCGLVPFQPDPPRVYAALDIVVQASTKSEPFGRTVAEAMASGKAVVAPRAGGILEQMSPDLQESTFSPGDAPGLAKLLTHLVTDDTLRARLAAQGRAHASEHLDFLRLGPATTVLYEGLASGSLSLRNDERMDRRPPGQRSGPI